MSKYYVKACPNCKYHCVDKKARTHKCEIDNKRMSEWYDMYGRQPQRNWSPEMNLDCYEPDSKAVHREEMKENLDDFMSDINNLLK